MNVANFFGAQAEYNLFGFFVPWWLAVGIVAYLLAFGTSTLLERCDWMRFVWNPPLLFIAFFAFWFAVLGLSISR